MTMTDIGREEIAEIRAELVAKGWLEAHGERGGETVWRLTEAGRANKAKQEREQAFTQGEATPLEGFILENPDREICAGNCDWGPDSFDAFPDLNVADPYRRLDWTGWTFNTCTRCGALCADLTNGLDRQP
jgi:hypothetical protein